MPRQSHTQDLQVTGKGWGWELKFQGMGVHLCYAFEEMDQLIRDPAIVRAAIFQLGAKRSWTIFSPLNSHTLSTSVIGLISL